MSPGKPHPDGEPVASEAVVEGEAVELPIEAPAPAVVPPVPVGEEPVAVVTPGAEPGGTVPLAEAAPFYASGHAHGTGPSWPEPVLALAEERPEVVVGAAFVGGILLAAILRRLGS